MGSMATPASDATETTTATGTVVVTPRERPHSLTPAAAGGAGEAGECYEASLTLPVDRSQPVELTLATEQAAIADPIGSTTDSDSAAPTLSISISCTSSDGPLIRFSTTLETGPWYDPVESHHGSVPYLGDTDTHRTSLLFDEPVAPNSDLIDGQIKRLSFGAQLHDVLTDWLRDLHSVNVQREIPTNQVLPNFRVETRADGEYVAYTDRTATVDGDASVTKQLWSRALVTTVHDLFAQSADERELSVMAVAPSTPRDEHGRVRFRDLVAHHPAYSPQSIRAAFDSLRSDYWERCFDTPPHVLTAADAVETQPHPTRDTVATTDTDSLSSAVIESLPPASHPDAKPGVVALSSKLAGPVTLADADTGGGETADSLFGASPTDTPGVDYTGRVARELGTQRAWRKALDSPTVVELDESALNLDPSNLDIIGGSRWYTIDTDSDGSGAGAHDHAPLDTRQYHAVVQLAYCGEAIFDVYVTATNDYTLKLTPYGHEYLPEPLLQYIRQYIVANAPVPVTPVSQHDPQPFGDTLLQTRWES